MDERIPSYPPPIPPVTIQMDRPLWSVMIPAYNCHAYLKETLESVLKQDPGPGIMQIEVIDDASTDADISALVAEIGKGRVGYFRQPVNRGSLRNFETCIKRAHGHWVHILHGDDLVMEGFYEEIEHLFNRFPEAGAAYTGFAHINEKGRFLSPNDPVLAEPGIIANWLSIIARYQKIQTPAIVVKRSVYERLGSFFAVHYGEDWEMWVRIAAHYPVAHSPKSLAKYRVHTANISSRYFLTGQNIRDIAKVIDIIRQYVPAEERAEIINEAKRNWSMYFARTSDMTYGFYKLPYQALQQSKMAFLLHKNKVTTYYFLKTAVKVLIRYKF